MIAEKINDLQAQPSQPSLPLQAASPLPRVSAGRVSNAEKKIYDYAEKVTARARENSPAKPPPPTDLPPEEWQRYIDRQINKKFRRLLMQMIIKLEEDERSSK